MQWTAGQQAAIAARNDSVLVSAAAGSGKTAVLVERVVALMKEGIPIDRMLIVTFTRAAAGEMRERISRRLENEAGGAFLRRQALRVSRAMICTLHVFCARVLREHFEPAGVDPMCRIADEDRLETLRGRALDETLENAYAAPTADESALFSQFEDAQIVALVTQLRAFLSAQADPAAWAAEHCTPEAVGLSAWTPLLERLCEMQLQGAQELLPMMETLLNRADGPERYHAAFDADAAMTGQLLESAAARTLTGGKTAFARLTTKKPGESESPDVTAQFRALREEWKKRVTAARALLPEDAERAEADLRYTLPSLRALCELAQKTEARYFALKQEKNYLDYGDLEHLTLKALRDPAVRSAVAAQYDALFVDEYQDVSGIQEAIVRALHENGKNLLFMVGDVKQSIYRFRLADPTLFLQKYRDYSLAEDAPQRKILLQQNFRSHENVLLATNQVFAHAMRERETEIAYDEAAMLRPGGGQPFGAPVEIHLITADEEGEGELSKGYRYEAAYLVRRIRELMRTATVEDHGAVRPVRYRDIALLTRYASGRAPYIARVLQLSGVPVYSDADAQYFDLPEVADFMNLLRVIDNPLQDIPLLAALRCPCFAFSEEELARIRLVERTPGAPFYQAVVQCMAAETPLSEKLRAAWARLTDWRFLAGALPVERLIWRVLAESGLYMRAGAQPEGELRQANLRLLAERAQGESADEGLGAFLRETGRVRSGDDGKTAKTLGENEDVVRILTLHKSKGLEFPVVFLLETARPFRKGGEESLRLHARYGMAVKYIDGERRVTRESCAMNALGGVGECESRAEEARLLYVGMTRARERLILLGAPRRLGAQQEKWRRGATAYAAGSADSMLDWVMESLGGVHEGQWIAENGSVWETTLESAEQLTMPAPPPVAPPQDDAGDVPERVIRRLTRKMPPQPVLKTSVTAMAKTLREEGDDWESPADKRVPPMDAPTLPVFLQDDAPTPAQRGTVTHRVLGLIDYELVRQGQWKRALDTLAQKGLLSETEREGLRVTWLKRFFASDVGRRALKAAHLRREWAFNLRAGEKTLVQGVIDLCFLEDAGWTLVDYKTDAVDGEGLRARYAEQMRWYARALAEITGAPVREALLFSLRRGEAYDVSLKAD